MFGELQAKVLDGENYLEDAGIRASFIGKHIGYNVEDCAMVYCFIHA